MSPREVFSLDEREVTWLCFHAFQSCLRKKQSRYGELLKFLRKGLSQLRLPAEDVKTVVDTSQHAVFKLIGWKHMQASCSIGTLSSHFKLSKSSSDTLLTTNVFAKCWWEEGAKSLRTSLHAHVASACGSTTASVLYKSSREGYSTETLLNKTYCWLSEKFFALLVSNPSDISRGVVLNFFDEIIILLGSLKVVFMCGFNFLF